MITTLRKYPTASKKLVKFQAYIGEEFIGDFEISHDISAHIKRGGMVNIAIGGFCQEIRRFTKIGVTKK